MSPEEKQYIKEQVASISDEYIRLMFNLDEERELVQTLINQHNLIDYIISEFSGQDNITVKELLDYFHRQLIISDKYKTEIDFIEAQYDIAAEIRITVYEEIPETDQQVVDRLVARERHKLKTNLINKFNAPHKKAKEEVQRQKLEEKQRKQQELEIKRAKAILLKNGFQVSGLE